MLTLGVYGTITALEVVRLVITTSAMWYACLALRRHYGWYRHSLDSADPDATDALVVNARLDLVIVIISILIWLGALISLATPPPVGQGPYSVSAIVNNAISSAIGALIIIVKEMNRVSEQRIKKRIVIRLNAHEQQSQEEQEELFDVSDRHS